MYGHHHWDDGFPKPTPTLKSDGVVETFALRRPCKVVRTSQTVLVYTAATWTWATLNCLEIEFWHLTWIKNEWGHLIEKFKRHPFYQCVCFYFFFVSTQGEKRWAGRKYKSELKTQKNILGCVVAADAQWGICSHVLEHRCYLWPPYDGSRMAKCVEPGKQGAYEAWAFELTEAQFHLGHLRVRSCTCKRWRKKQRGELQQLNCKLNINWTQATITWWTHDTTN